MYVKLRSTARIVIIYCSDTSHELHDFKITLRLDVPHTWQHSWDNTKLSFQISKIITQPLWQRRRCWWHRREHWWWQPWPWQQERICTDMAWHPWPTDPIIDFIIINNNPEAPDKVRVH